MRAAELRLPPGTRASAAGGPVKAMTSASVAEPPWSGRHQVVGGRLRFRAPCSVFQTSRLRHAEPAVTQAGRRCARHRPGQGRKRDLTRRDETDQNRTTRGSDCSVAWHQLRFVSCQPRISRHCSKVARPSNWSTSGPGRSAPSPGSSPRACSTRRITTPCSCSIGRRPSCFSATMASAVSTPLSTSRVKASRIFTTCVAASTRGRCSSIRPCRGTD